MLASGEGPANQAAWLFYFFDPKTKRWIPKKRDA